MTAHTITDVMLDLETLDTVDTAVVISIGAFAFNRNDIHKPTHGFHEIVGGKDHREEQKLFGRTTSNETIAWWKKQSPEAKVIFKTNTCDDTAHMLAKFATWLAELPCLKLRVWGNGATFDNTILASLYRTYGMDVPWNTFNDRCHRTIKEHFGSEGEPVTFIGTKHDALDDATNQAQKLCSIIQGLKAKGVYL